MDKALFEKLGVAENDPVRDAFADIFAAFENSDADPADLLERFRKPFMGFAYLVHPRVYASADPVPVTHYVLPAGSNANDMPVYRIIEMGGRRDGTWLDILDLKSLPSLESLYGHENTKKLKAAGRDKDIDTYLSQIMLVHDNTFKMRHTLAHHVTQVEDISYFDDAGHWPLEALGGVVSHFTQLLLDAAQDVIAREKQPEATRDYLEGKIRAVLNQHLAGAISKAMPEIRERLDQAALRILAQNPSTLKLNTYQWLACASEAQYRVNRKTFAAAYPITLLGPLKAQNSPLKALDKRVSVVPEDVARLYFGTADRALLSEFSQLREAHTGTDIAARLRGLVPFVARLHTPLSLRVPENWQMIARVADASHETGRLLERTPEDVFGDIADTLADEQAWQSFVDTHFAEPARQSAYGRYDRVTQARRLIERHVLSLYVPKFRNLARGLGADIPARQAVWILSGALAVENDAGTHVPAPLRKHIHSGGTPLSHLLATTHVAHLFAQAARFPKYRDDDWDRDMRMAFISTRMFTHPLQYPFYALPERAIANEDIYIRPVSNQAELTIDSRDARHSLLWDGWRAVAEKAHFVTLRREDTQILATAILQEPDAPGKDWRIETLAYAPGVNRDCEKILADIYLPQLRRWYAQRHHDIHAHRGKLMQTFKSTARSRDIIGHNDRYPAQNRAAVEKLAKCLLLDEYRIGPDGCASEDRMNQVLSFYARAAAPYYQRADLIDLSALPGSPAPEIG
jgi:hypothetical protein